VRAEDGAGDGPGALEISISVEMDRQAAEAVQLEARRLLEQAGLRVVVVKVRREVDAGPDPDGPSAERP
jgi:hypothetical protein